MKYERWIRPEIHKALENRRIVLLVGLKESGKTTLVKTLRSEHIEYRTLDDLTLLNSARNDPQVFVKRDKPLMIIDEVQRVPELLLAVKQVVDEDDTMGQYLLTGSADIQQLPRVRESLAGRVTKLCLRPLAQGEIVRSQVHFLKDAFSQHFINPSIHYDKDDMIKMALCGGFPEPLQCHESQARIAWHQDYMNAILDHDLKDIVNIRRRNSMQSLVEVLSAWSSKYMDLSAIQSGLSIRRATLETYMNALEALFVIERLPAWAKTDYGRVGKRSKLYMRDSGMMASLLNWKQDAIRFDDDKVGKLIETWVYNEIAANVGCQRAYKMYHYRDRDKREIDLLIERNDGALLGIEVKAGSAIKFDHFKHLKWFHENIVKSKQAFVGIILYTGEKLVPFADNLWAVPIACML